MATNPTASPEATPAERTRLTDARNGLLRLHKVLLDWEQPGRGAPLSDLAWYLAINCRRLPQSKQASIAAYREALEGRGIDTGPWWDRQLALCLLGAMVLFGWEKALGGYDEELAWWETKSLAAAALLS